MGAADKRIPVPASIRAFGSRRGEAGEAWVDRLPEVVSRLATKWQVELDAPFDGLTGAWVAPGVRADGTDVVVKVAWPHEEARTEAAGLRFFAGVGAAHLYDAEEAEFALLLERCRPGDDLWTLAVDEANAVAANVLRRLWREVPDPAAVAPITTLADTVAAWPPEAADVGGRLLATQVDVDVVVHGDFNPFNVLRSQREPWLVVDPKPLVGERAYDLAQYLANRLDAALRLDPVIELSLQIRHLSETLQLDPRRVAAWAFVKSIGWDWGADTTAILRRVMTTI